MQLCTNNTYLLMCIYVCYMYVPSQEKTPIFISLLSWNTRIFGRRKERQFGGSILFALCFAVYTYLYSIYYKIYNLQFPVYIQQNTRNLRSK